MLQQRAELVAGLQRHEMAGAAQLDVPSVGDQLCQPHPVPDGHELVEVAVHDRRGDTQVLQAVGAPPSENGAELGEQKRASRRSRHDLVHQLLDQLRMVVREAGGAGADPRRLHVLADGVRRRAPPRRLPVLRRTTARCAEERADGWRRRRAARRAAEPAAPTPGRSSRPSRDRRSSLARLRWRRARSGHRRRGRRSCRAPAPVSTTPCRGCRSARPGSAAPGDRSTPSATPSLRPTSR